MLKLMTLITKTVSIISEVCKQRGIENTLIIFSLFTTFVAVLLFSIYRFYSGEYIIAATDFFISLILFIILIQTLRNKLNQKVRFLLVFAYSFGALTVLFLKGGKLIYWAYPPMISTFFLLSIRHALTINFLFLLAIIPTAFFKVERIEFYSILTTFIILYIFGYILTARFEYQRKLLNQLASLDPLTNTLNKRSLNSQISQIIVENQRYSEKSTLMILDLDFFKRINDTYGHNVGDQALIKFTELLKTSIRNLDTIYRFGGEEFVVISKKTNLENALKLADRIRKTIEEKLIIEQTLLTVSIGVAELTKKDDSSSWLNKADQALYKAKKSGRNTVCSYTEKEIQVTPSFKQSPSIA